MPIVKRYKAHLPDGQGEYEQETVKVHLDSKSGFFAIDLPTNISDVIRHIDLPDRYSVVDQYRKMKGPVNDEFTGRRIVAGSLQGVMDEFKYICLAFHTWSQDQVAEQYLKVVFAYNVKHVDGFHNAEDAPAFREFSSWNGGRSRAMSFAGTPAMELRYMTRWKINGRFFEKSKDGRWYADQDGDRHGGRNAGKTNFIRWTQEREDFFAKVDHGLTGMICKMIEFFEDLEGNMDLAIESGSHMLALPNKES